jgi:hypothetical protein
MQKEPVTTSTQIEPESLASFGSRLARLKHPLTWLWLLAGGLLLAKLLFSLNIMWQILNFAFQVDESESMIVAETLLMSRGTDIYARPGLDLFVSAPYTPFYYLLNWPFIQLFGISFKPGRLISFLAACGIAWLIYRFVIAYSLRRNPECPNRPAALLASLAWGSLGLVAFWGIAVKPDILALFLSLSGLYLVPGIRYQVSGESHQPSAVSRQPSAVSRQPDTTPGLALSTRHSALSTRHFPFLLPPSSFLLPPSLFALAALTKQTAFAGVLAAIVWLVLRKGAGPKVALRFGLIYAALAFGPMLIMNLLSNGGFWYHIVTVHELPWNGQNYSKFFGGLAQSYQLFGLLALVFVGYWLVDIFAVRPGGWRSAWERLRTDPGTLLILYAGTAWGAGLSAGTYGGNHNHLLEFCAAGCIALGAALVRLTEWWQTAPRRDFRRFGLVIALLLICWQGLGLFMGEARVKPEDFPVLGGVAPARSALEGLRGQFLNEDWLGLEYRAPLEKQKQRLAEVAAFMNNDRGPLIYSDNVSLMLATSKPLFTTDPFTQTHATHYGRWDQSKLLSLVNQSQFSLIVLRQPIERRPTAGDNPSDIYFSPELAQAVLENYKLACRDVAFIYVPKSRTDFKGC